MSSAYKETKYAHSEKKNRTQNIDSEGYVYIVLHTP